MLLKKNPQKTNKRKRNKKQTPKKHKKQIAKLRLHFAIKMRNSYINTCNLVDHNDKWQEDRKKIS